MKTCLVCQKNSDQIELFRVPVSVEGNRMGDMLVCRECFELLGVDEVKGLVAAAVREQAFEPSQFLSAEGET